jgi:dolichyl-phosphate beta-glucosyltransferase
VLVLLSPPLVVPSAKDKTFRSRKSPTKPLPLPSVHDPAEVDLTVVIPAYNETKRMPAMLQAALDHLKSPTSAPRSFELLIVDDGSSDGTSELALDFAREHPESEVRVVTLHKNQGKGGAVRHGMMHGRGRRLIFADADGASRFEDLELLWTAMDEHMPKADSAAIAIGSRAHLVKTEAVVKVRSVAVCLPPRRAQT